MANKCCFMAQYSQKIGAGGMVDRPTISRYHREAVAGVEERFALANLFYSEAIIIGECIHKFYA